MQQGEDRVALYAAVALASVLQTAGVAPAAAEIPSLSVEARSRPGEPMLAASTRRRELRIARMRAAPPAEPSEGDIPQDEAPPAAAPEAGPSPPIESSPVETSPGAPPSQYSAPSQGIPPTPLKPLPQAGTAPEPQSSPPEDARPVEGVEGERPPATQGESAPAPQTEGPTN